MRDTAANIIYNIMIVAITCMYDDHYWVDRYHQLSVYQPACHESHLNFSLAIVSLQDALHSLKREAIKTLATPFRYAHTYYNNNYASP